MHLIERVDLGINTKQNLVDHQTSEQLSTWLRVKTIVSHHALSFCSQGGAAAAPSSVNA